MKLEIHSTAKFFEQFLEKRKSDDSLKVKKFLYTLVVLLEEKFENHWYPSQPSRGNAYRCLQSIGSKVDPIINKSMKAANAEFSRQFPANLTVWIDPGEVSYKIGEFGSICDLELLREPLSFEDVTVPLDELEIAPPSPVSATSQRLSPVMTPKKLSIPSISSIPSTPSNRIPSLPESLTRESSNDKFPSIQEESTGTKDEGVSAAEITTPTKAAKEEASNDGLAPPTSPVRERDIPSPNPFRVWSAPRSRRARSAINIFPDPPQFYSPPAKNRRASEITPSPSKPLLSPASLRRFTPSFINLPDVSETMASLNRASAECQVSN